MPFEPKPEYRLAQDTISSRDLADLCEWLATNPWLTQGKIVREFESQFAAKVNAKHAIFVNSGSSANLLAWFWPIAHEWLNGVPEGMPSIKEHLRVAVPAVSWATTVMPAMQFGYQPVLCESDEKTWGIDPADLRRICESERGKPSIVALVHVLGVPCDMAAIAELEKEFKFLLLEDSCAAFGSSPVGSVGEISTYSTYYAHQFSTVEGGFVTTNDDAAANLLRMLRAHGWTSDCDAPTKKLLAEQWKIDPFREKFTFYVPGFNVRGTDLQAKIGLSQLRRVDAMTATRVANHALYRAHFTAGPNVKHFAVQTPPEGAKVASIGFGVLASSQAHRAKVAEALLLKGIETRPICAGNISRQPFWWRIFGEPQRERPIADRIHNAGFQLPNHALLTSDDVAYIAETVLAVTP